MIRKLILPLLTVIIICAMWFNSPAYRQTQRIEVYTIQATQKNIYDSVVARGTIEEGSTRDIRLEHTAKIKKVHVSVGDHVNSGDILFEVTPAKENIPDVTQVMKMLPNLGVSSEDAITAFSQIDGYEDILRDLGIESMPSNAAATEVTPEICAPISGVITGLHVKEGDIAGSTGTIVSVSDFNKLQVKVSIPELYISRIKTGQTVQITGEAFAGKEYIGTVTKINPVAKQKTALTGTGETVIDTFVKIESPDGRLKPGYSVSAKIFTDSRNNAIMIPYECIQQDNNKNEYVYVEHKGTVYKKFIKTGFELDSEVEVRQGLKNGEKVVINPQSNLYNRALVKTRGGA